MSLTQMTLCLRLRWSDPSDLLNRGVTRSGDNSCGMELSSQYLFVRIADAPEQCDSNIRFPRPKEYRELFYNIF